MKITEFTLAIEKEIEKKISEKIRLVESALGVIRNDFARLKDYIANKIHELTSLPLSDIERLQEASLELDRQISNIDFKGLSDSYALERDARDEDLKTQREMLTDMQNQLNLFSEKQQKQLREHDDMIKHLQTNRSRPKKGNNNNYRSNSGHNNDNNRANTNDRKGVDFESRSSRDRPPTKQTNIIMCMDSNRKFINFRKLWTLDGSKRLRTSTLKTVKTFIHNEKSSDVKYFFISVGTNDIDTKDPEVILDEYIEIVDLLRAKYPGIQIIVNELPPRKVNHDDKTQSMNVLLRELGRVNDFIHIASQENLRDDIDKSMFDDKHVHRRVVGLFAGNIKRALRKAYGHPEPVRDDTVKRP